MEPVPFNDPSRAVLAQHHELMAAFDAVLQSGRYILGPEVEAFEHEFAAWVGGRHVVGVGNGSDALEIALRAAGVSAGHEVVTVANAGGYTSTAAHAIGAVPVYADVLDHNLLIDPTAVAAAVTRHTRAVVVTHLYGQVADVAAVRGAVSDHIAVLEDCAQAHGASSLGVPVGTVGDLATFSFYPTKNLGGIGDGGAVVANEHHAEHVRRLRTYGWGAKYRVDDSGGRNTRLDEVQAALLRVRLRTLLQGNLRRHHIAATYRSAAPHLQWVGGLDHNVHHLCVLRVAHRDEVRRHLAERGVGTDVHYPIADHHQPAWTTANPPSLPVTERATGEILSVPCFPELTDDEVARVAAALAAVGTTSHPQS